MSIKRVSSYLILCLFLFSCSNQKHDVAISGVEVNLELKRFEKDLFNTTDYESLKAEYGYFFDVYVNNVLSINPSNPILLSNGLKDFCADPEISEIYKAVNLQYEDFEPYYEEIKTAFKYYRYHFPKKPIPDIITFVSGFNYGVISLDSALGIGLDMFLGKDYSYYAALQFPMYKRNKLQPQKLPYAAIKGWLETEFMHENNNQSCLSRMIERGKILYAMDALFPFTEDSIKINYNPPQMIWAEENEVFVWATLVDQKLLYEKNFSKTYKLFNDGPFTSLFEQTSAPRIGEYIGWQIVRSYMENNEVTLSDLMKENDEQSFLAKSNYKPKR